MKQKSIISDLLNCTTVVVTDLQIREVYVFLAESTWDVVTWFGELLPETSLGMMLRLVALRGRHLYPSNPTHVATQLQGVRRHFAAGKPCQPQPPHRVLQEIPSFSNKGSSIRAFSGTTSASNESAGLLSWYLRMLDKYPLATKSLTAAPIFAFSDITAQVRTVSADLGY